MGIPPESAPKAARRFVRPQRRRVISGVAAAASVYFHVKVSYVRLAFVVLSFAAGFGIVLYVLLALFTPSAPRIDDDVDPASLSPSRADRVMVRLQDSRQRGAAQLLTWAAGLFVASVVLLFMREPLFSGRPSFVIPIVVMVVGVVLSWWQLSRYGSAEEAAGMPRLRMPGLIVQAVGGVVVATGGALMLVLQGLSVSDMLRAAVAAIAVLAGVALIVAPWWLRLWNELLVTREERAREANRAEMAAHIHDSVLQTLALIRTNAADSAQVAQLARAQERELREWLYQGSSSSQLSLAQELRDLAAEIEDTRRTSDGDPAVLELVCVGDRQPDEATEVLVQAAREAMLNAVAHGAAPFSVYMEAAADVIDIYVTDRGSGFDVDAIPADRFGVRQSIIGRMERGGGSATIRTLPAGGTEVHLQMPIGA